MNLIDSIDMVRAAILGTFVADASGMGLHWIYSQGKLGSIVKANDGQAEFLEPDESNYRGVPAFFAHPYRHAGDASNYGEYIYILLRSLSEAGFDAGVYVREFQDFFGVGGPYVGYADAPMRETIFNIAALGKEIYQRVMECESSLDDDHKASAAHYISRYFFEFDQDGLKREIETPFKLQEWSKNEIKQAQKLVDQLGSTRVTIGSNDDQMPALSRSAILAHFYDGTELDEMIERAVRITNNNDVAVAYSKFMAHIMRGLYRSGADAERGPSQLRRLVETNLSILPQPSEDLISASLEYKELDIRTVTKRFGAACHADMAVPVTIHILMNTSNFRDANRANILASGDNCGRAIMLGAIAGTMYGVGGESGIPQEWIDKSTIVERSRTTVGGRLLLS